MFNDLSVRARTDLLDGARRGGAGAARTNEP